MTYGAYQESASCALVRILSAPAPARSEETDLILAYRSQILATLMERVQHLLGGRTVDSVRRVRTTHESLIRRPVQHLAITLADFERPNTGLESPPTELLQRAVSSQPAAESWREAARDLFLATTELLRAEHQPWISHPRAAWPLIADVADVVQALILLDARFPSDSSLAHRSSDSVAARLLTAANVGRIARLLDTDDIADGATAHARASLVGEPSIAMVRGPLDLVVAERRLAVLVRPHKRNYDLGLSLEQPGLTTARALAAGQAALLSSAAEQADRLGVSDMADRFRERVQAYRDLHQSTVRVVDVIPRRSVLPLLQQIEISTYLRSHGQCSRLSVQELGELAAASAAVALTLGKALRREGLAYGHIQALKASHLGLPRPTPLSNVRHPFLVACAALTDTSSLKPSGDAPVHSRAQRTMLKHVLAESRLPSAPKHRGLRREE